MDGLLPANLRSSTVDDGGDDDVAFLAEVRGFLDFALTPRTCARPFASLRQRTPITRSAGDGIGGLIGAAGSPPHGRPSGAGCATHP